MANEDDRPLECVHQLPICAKLGDQAIREGQYPISGCLARVGEGFDVVMVKKNPDVMSLVWEQVSQP